MALVTGSPIGALTPEDTVVDGAPYIYFQSYDATPLNNPDGDGYYWNLSGTSTYPVFSLGCIDNVSLTEGVTMNAVRCDTVGDKDMVQRRDYIDFVFNLSTPFPLSAIRYVMNSGESYVLDSGDGYEKMGLGQINNNLRWMVYAPKVYDATAGDYVMVHLHRAKFVDAWTIQMNAGSAWSITGLKLRAFVDDTKPAGQEFGVILRSDASVL